MSFTHAQKTDSPLRYTQDKFSGLWRIFQDINTCCSAMLAFYISTGRLELILLLYQYNKTTKITS